MGRHGCFHSWVISTAVILWKDCQIAFCTIPSTYLPTDLLYQKDCNNKKKQNYWRTYFNTVNVLWNFEDISLCFITLWSKTSRNGLFEPDWLIIRWVARKDSVLYLLALYLTIEQPGFAGMWWWEQLNWELLLIFPGIFWYKRLRTSDPPLKKRK